MIEKLTFGLFTQEDSRSFMRLMAYIRPYKTRIIFALIAILASPPPKAILPPSSPPWSTKVLPHPPRRPNCLPPPVSSPPCKTGANSFTYMIWGTENKIWTVPPLSHHPRHHQRNLPLRQHLFHDLGFRHGESAASVKTCSPKC